jgi:hypothetical protein
VLSNLAVVDVTGLNVRLGSVADVTRRVVFGPFVPSADLRFALLERWRHFVSLLLRDARVLFSRLGACGKARK